MIDNHEGSVRFWKFGLIFSRILKGFILGRWKNYGKYISGVNNIIQIEIKYPI